MFRRRLDQTAFGLICVAKHLQRACLPSTSEFHSGSGAGLHPWIIQLSQLRICNHDGGSSEFVDYGHEQMEPKTERMCLPQWDGDPQWLAGLPARGPPLQDRREPRGQLVSCSATGWRTQRSGTTSRSGDDVAHSTKHPSQWGMQGCKKPSEVLKP